MAAAYGILLFVTLIWGATFPLVQIALGEASPFAFVSVRFAVASLLFIALSHKKLIRLPKRTLVQGMALGVFLCGGYILQTMGLARTSAARSGFITGLLVPLTPVFSWLIFRRAIRLRLWAAVGLAFVGLAIMSRPEAGGLNTGDVLTLFCAIFFALHVAAVSQWARPDNQIQLTGLQLAITAVIAALAVPFEAGAHYDVSLRLISLTVFVAAFASAFAISMQVKFQPRISPAAAAVIYACEPVFAGLAAWLMLGNVPPRATLIGAAFIVAAMVVSTVPVKPKPVPA